jgi:hypothetical protein
MSDRQNDFNNGCGAIVVIAFVLMILLWSGAFRGCSARGDGVTQAARLTKPTETTK